MNSTFANPVFGPDEWYKISPERIFARRVAILLNEIGGELACAILAPGDEVVVSNVSHNNAVFAQAGEVLSQAGWQVTPMVRQQLDLRLETEHQKTAVLGFKISWPVPEEPVKKQETPE
jgi:hypothetical protein